MYTKHGTNDLDLSSHNVKSSPFNMVDSSVDGRENRGKKQLACPLTRSAKKKKNDDKNTKQQNNLLKHLGK